MAGYAIHSAIHAAQPDIHAAAHSHSYYGRAFSALGRNIDLANYGERDAFFT
jgi:ribulose-5-phosphate 4-epimerase/fuculose-1-phosphate aldolase